MSLKFSCAFFPIVVLTLLFTFMLSSCNTFFQVSMSQCSSKLTSWNKSFKGYIKHILWPVFASYQPIGDSPCVDVAPNMVTLSVSSVLAHMRHVIHFHGKRGSLEHY